MGLDLDHIVFVASDLGEGAAWMTRKLGVEPQAGGRHPDFGTHNALWRLGDAYLEVIAVDPQAASVDGPRWFALDDPETLSGSDGTPRLLTWAARSTDIETDSEAAPVDLGTITTGRRGDLSWKLTLAPEGRPLMGGAVPFLIQWPDAPPPEAMEDTGLRLTRFECEGGDAMLGEVLEVMGVDHLIAIERAGEGAPRLIAGIETPDGTVTFGEES